MKENARTISHTLQAVLVAYGVPETFARMQGDLLLEAQMRGFASHGLLRLPRIIERIVNGVTSPTHSCAPLEVGEVTPLTIRSMMRGNRSNPWEAKPRICASRSRSACTRANGSGTPYAMSTARSVWPTVRASSFIKIYDI